MSRNRLGEQVVDRGKSVIYKWREDNPGKILDFTDAHLVGCDLSGCDLRQANFERANLTGCNLENCIFDGSNLFHTNLFAARLVGARFNIVNMQCANLQNAVLGRFNYAPEKRVLYVENAQAAGFNQVDLRKVNFSGAMLHGVAFQECGLTEANFTGAALEVVKFIDCELIRVKFNQASLVCAQICGGVLRQSDLSNADLFWTVFHGIEEVSANNDHTAIFSKESRRDYVSCLEAKFVQSIGQGRGGKSFQVESPGEIRAEATGTHGRNPTVVELSSQVSHPNNLSYRGPTRGPAKD